MAKAESGYLTTINFFSRVVTFNLFGGTRWKIIMVLPLCNKNACLWRSSERTWYISGGPDPPTHTFHHYLDTRPAWQMKKWLFDNGLQQFLWCKERLTFLRKEMGEELRLCQGRKAAPAEWAWQLRWSQAWTLSVTLTCRGCSNEQVCCSNSNFDFFYNAVTLQLSRTCCTL